MKTMLLPLLLTFACGTSAPASSDGTTPGAPDASGGGDDGGAPPAAGDAADAPDAALRNGPLPGVARVWAVHDGEKIDRDDRTNPAASGNEAWDGQKIRLFGAKNEIVAFQLVLEASGDGVHGMSAALPRLSRRGGTEKIVYSPPGDDPSASLGRPIQIFVENYMNVTAATHASWIFPSGSPAAPANPLGYKPVQLVPENATRGRGGLPIDVAPNQNQALWVEVYMGRGLPAGKYDGVVTVTVAGGAARDVPVELSLYDFELPDDPTMKAMLYFEPEQVDLYEGTGLVDRFHRFAHRERVELVNAYDAASLNAAIGRFDGSAFNAQSGYEGPGEGTGNRIAPATFYDPGTDYDTKSTAWKTADAWMTLLAQAAPAAQTFIYMPDEPSSADFPRIKTIASNIKSDPGPGKALPTFVTTAYTSALDGSIDIWCSPPPTFDVTKVASIHANGQKMWFYNGGRPAVGAIIIDSPATDARMMPWAGFKYGVEVYYYWHSVHWQHNQQKVGDRIQNVWANPITFDNRGQPGKTDTGFANGDGVLLYPGTEKLHPDQDRGVAGPVASIQLANLRRGLQDHMYLSLARSRGADAAVTSALDAIVPHVFSEAGSTVSFPEHGDAYEKARRALAEAIAKP